MANSSSSKPRDPLLLLFGLVLVTACLYWARQAPGIKILIGRWGETDNKERVEKRLLAAGADRVAWTLRDSRAQLVPLLQVETANAAPPQLVTSR